MPTHECPHGYTDRQACYWCKPPQPRKPARPTRRRPWHHDWQIDEDVLAEYIKAVYSWLPPRSAYAAAVADWKAGDVARWQARRTRPVPPAEVQETLL